MCVFSEIDECSEGTSNCDHICINTNGSYTCDCDSGHFLQPDGHTCQCGGSFTAVNGSFQTPGWPTSYPRENFQCEWHVQLSDHPGATIEFSIDSSAFGIRGRPPCTNDHIEFFDGTDTSSPSLNKICGTLRFYEFNLPTITTTSSEAMIMFTSGSTGNALRPGVRVTYRSV